MSSRMITYEKLGARGVLYIMRSSGASESDNTAQGRRLGALLGVWLPISSAVVVAGSSIDDDGCCFVTRRETRSSSLFFYFISAP